MKRVLLVEDDPTLGGSLHQRLSQDYEVSWARSVQESRQYLSQGRWDLAILDIGLPDGDGFEVAQLIREKEGCHFIFLTAQSDAQSRLRGFEMGAHEFIPKPFYLKELLMRVEHVLDTHVAKKTLSLHEFEVDLVELSVRRIDGRIEYPPVTDMKILKFLIEQAPRVVSRDEILDAVWGADKTPNHRSIDNAVVRLRQVLGVDGERIRSVRGVGYQWQGEIE